MRSFPLILSVALLGCRGTGDVDTEPPPPETVAELLDGLDEVVSWEGPYETLPAYDIYRVGIRQPIDHADPDGPSFVQWLTLRHVGFDRPMVLHTTGYDDYTEGYQDEVSWLLTANSVTVEHRFFGASVPDDGVPWDLLTVAQSSDDHHRVVEALKLGYREAWVSTGASKGGETVLLHRHAWPEDVDGTIAYVAPFNVELPDPRYPGFFDTLEPACRDAVRAVQVEALSRPAVKEAWLAHAANQGIPLDHLGSDDAFGYAAVELEWYFWQYDSRCDRVPASDVGDEELATFFIESNGPGNYSDSAMVRFGPYYFQSAAELGYPEQPVEHLGDLVSIDVDDVAPYLPVGVEVPAYEPADVLDAAAWVEGEAEGIALIYGTVDPWTAGALEVAAGTESLRVDVPGANHLANIRDAPEAERESLMDALETWTGFEARRPWNEKSSGPPQRVRIAGTR